METLYEIKEEYIKALNSMEVNEDGEISEDSLKLIDGLKGEFEEKAENVALFIKDQLSMADSIDAEIKKLQERKKAHGNKVEWLKKYLADMMIQSSRMKIETGKVALSFRKSTSVNILDETLIPENYFKTEIVSKIDKMAISKELKSGKEIDGAVLIENQNLQIK